MPSTTMGEQITSVSGGGAPSNDYWREMDGATYEEMLRERETNANRSYQEQEGFLRRFIASEQERVARRLELLEFGCGFGRHARYLGSLPEVRYHGYDFSEKMVAPLREHPPAGLEPIADRLFVGLDVAAAVGSRRFDTVFTVSVLIHNPPQAVSRLLDGMLQVLAPGGTICLVENKLVPVSVFENAWHQGCWLHSYPELAPAGFDLHIGQDLIGTHDVYLLTPNGGARTRFFALRMKSDGNGAPHELSCTDLDAMSVPKIRAWAQSVQGAVSNLPRSPTSGSPSSRRCCAPNGAAKSGGEGCLPWPTIWSHCGRHGRILIRSPLRSAKRNRGRRLTPFCGTSRSTRIGPRKTPAFRAWSTSSTRNGTASVHTPDTRPVTSSRSAAAER